ncbi:BQ5605_C009g05534 [Microbotryum silenes-dioicae]|uniref:Conserved oligomeric Golgi complex subunit 6 n=1 Tax=Microbotryum silenes-dioicae TaxID=796604 RepID=A0A2X0MDP7_9BASI|nr:BQ5605_C009g05534 [Microbotryum silenes-dioicae]
MQTISRPSLSSHASPGLSASPSSASSSRNPLHLKVNRLLSANLEDAGTRAALDTLGELELEPQTQVGSSSRASQEPPTTTNGGLNGRTTAATTTAAGTPMIKRGALRTQVETQMAQASTEFLQAFSDVDAKLGLLQSHLDAMHTCCDQVEQQLASANSGTRYLLEHVEGLRQQRAATTVQQSLVHLFLTRFSLTDDELRILTSREIPVGPDLFAAMNKTERIRSDCRALLSGEAGQGTLAGLDIMEYTSQHLEAAYSKIYKWCTFEARGFGKDVLEVPSTMRSAIERLRSRPELLSAKSNFTLNPALQLHSEVLDLLGATRSTAIMNLFLDALTRGGPSGLPRPIELHAHDPIRYVGDMLAWIHQSTAGEREFLESLFGIAEDGRWVGSVRAQKGKRGRKAEGGAGSGAEGSVKTVLDEEDDEMRLRKLLDRDMEGCARPLKMRVQQTIKSQEGAIMAYRIATLIEFYKVTMEQTIGKDAHMCKVLAEITESAYEAFFDTLRNHGRSLLRFIQPPSAGLNAPPQLRDALTTLRELMAIFSSSYLEDAPNASSKTDAPKPNEAEDSTTTPTTPPTSMIKANDFSPVLDQALDPALEMCEKMVQSRPLAWDRSIFAINCIETVLSALDGFAFTADRTRQLKEEEGDHVESLTGEHVSFLPDEGLWEARRRLIPSPRPHYSLIPQFTSLLKDSGLENLLTTIRTKDPSVPLSSLPFASPTHLQACLQSFSHFLSTTDTLSSPRLSLLPPRIAASIHRSALERISGAYELVLDEVVRDAQRNGYEEGTVRALFRMGRDEVRNVLGVERG